MAGNCSNYFIVDERDGFQEHYADDISPGKLFGISAVIEPYISTMDVQANGAVKAIKIDAKPMLTICEADPKLGYSLMREINQVLIGQLSGATGPTSNCKINPAFWQFVRVEAKARK